MNEIRSWDDINTALGDLRRAAGEVAIQSALYDRKIAELQEARAARLREPQERQAVLEAAIAAWCKAHRDEIKGRTRKFTHGTLGWRKGAPKIRYTRGERFTLDALLARGHKGAVKVTEKVVKGELKKLTDEELTHVGVAIVAAERFFVDVAVDPIIEPMPDATAAP